MARGAQFEKSILPNGVRLVTERIPGVRSAALGIWVTVGSRHEPAELNGMSHFIEHMAFKGTATRSAMDIARTIERGGGHINAFTGKELTCFYVHVLDEQLPTAVDILTDILQNSVCEPSEIEKEKQVVLDEIRDHEDMPDGVAHELFISQVFGNHPLSRPILGPPENVSSFSQQTIKQFQSEHYTPSRIVVAAAGNVKHSQLEKLLEQKLALKKSKGKSKPETVSAMIPSVERKSRAIQQAHMLMGGRSVAYKSSERMTVSMLNTVLGGGMSSRLFQNIREKHGVAYSVYSYNDSLSDVGYFGIYLATDQSRVDRARELVFAELNDLKERAVSAQELEEIKVQYKGGLMLGLENTSSRMMRLARMEIYQGRYVSLDEISDKIDAVTPRKVQAMAGKLFSEQNLVTTILEPNGKAD
ncbi:MAG: insulinase family protein [Calditrichaeota bacterium]|nr:insulinase family protein [Calditrichota bacterium]MCB9366520.1 insulinase family protein [Calditrichota bacterium]MCB9391222.1 insulinase family protein [Calditrichota bacterium]